MFFSSYFRRYIFLHPPFLAKRMLKSLLNSILVFSRSFDLSQIHVLVLQFFCHLIQLSFFRLCQFLWIFPLDYTLDYSIFAMTFYIFMFRQLMIISYCNHSDFLKIFKQYHLLQNQMTTTTHNEQCIAFAHF